MRKEIWEEHELVFHYTDSIGLQGILESNSLHATHYKCLNDKNEILELLPKLHNHILPHINGAIIKLAKLNPKTTELIESKGGLTALSQHEAGAIVNALYKSTFEATGKPNFVEPFIVSFCGHKDKYEISNGLLSQWRAYGNGSGFSIAFDTKGLVKLARHECDAFAYNVSTFSDVFYDDNDEMFRNEFSELLSVLSDVVPRIFNNENPNYNLLFAPYLSAATRFKHRGFKEENEVRLVFPRISQFWANNLKISQPDEYEKIKKRTIKPVVFKREFRPYIDISANGLGRLPIRYIIVGPGPRKDVLKSRLEKYLDLRDLPIEVRLSDTPLV